MKKTGNPKIVLSRKVFRTQFLFLPMFLIVFLPATARAAIVYVGHSPDGQVRYNTTGCPVADGDMPGTLQQAVKASGTNGIGNICAGTYSGTEIVSPAGTLQHVYQNQTIQGATGNKSDVIIDGGASPSYHVIGLYMPGGIVRDLTVQNSGSGKYGFDITVNAKISNVDILNCDRGAYVRANAGGTYSRLRFKRVRGPYTIAFAGATQASTWNYSVFQDCAGVIAFLAPVTATFNNSIFTGFFDLVMSNGSSPYAVNVSVNNSIFSANNLDGLNMGIVQTYGKGTWTFNNSVLGDKPGAKASFLLNGSGGANVTYDNCPDTYSPAWVSTRSSGKVFFFLDDTPYINDWFTVADEANGAYGYPMSFAMYVSGTESWTDAQWRKVAEYIAGTGNGSGVANEIASHGQSDVRLYTETGDNVNAFTISGPHTVTIAVTHTDPEVSSTWTGTLQVDSDPPVSLTDSSYSTLDKLVTYLQVKGVTVGTAAGQIAYNSPTFKPKSICLAAGTYSSGSTVLFDQISLFVVELKESKAYLESKIRQYIPGWTCSTFVWCGGYHNSTAEQYALGTAGYSQARGVDGIDGTSDKISCLVVSQVRSSDAPSKLGVAAGDIAKETAGYLDALAHFGAIGGIHSHNLAAFSLANWTDVFDAVRASSGIQAMTFSGALDWARAGQDHARLNISYRCADETDSCMPDLSDYRLRPDSPCINRGSNAVWLGAANVTDYSGAAITDASGNIVAPGGVVDIGAYEYVSAVYSLTVLQNGMGSGSVSAPGLSCVGNTCTGNYPYGTVVNITAVPNNGSIFDKWIGCDFMSGNICTITLSPTASPIAVFDSGSVPVAVPAVDKFGFLTVFCIVLGIGVISLRRE
jgi:hypothetical protein